MRPVAKRSLYRQIIVRVSLIHNKKIERKRVVASFKKNCEIFLKQDC